MYLRNSLKSAQESQVKRTLELPIWAVELTFVLENRILAHPNFSLENYIESCDNLTSCSYELSFNCGVS